MGKPGMWLSFLRMKASVELEGFWIGAGAWLCWNYHHPCDIQVPGPSKPPWQGTRCGRRRAASALDACPRQLRSRGLGTTCTAGNFSGWEARVLGVTCGFLALSPQVPDLLCLCMYASHSVMSNSLRPGGLQSMGISRHEYWSGLPFPPRGDLSDPGIEPRSPALQADSLPAEASEKPMELNLKTFVWRAWILFFSWFWARESRPCAGVSVFPRGKAEMGWRLDPGACDILRRVWGSPGKWRVEWGGWFTCCWMSTERGVRQRPELRPPCWWHGEIGERPSAGLERVSGKRQSLPGRGTQAGQEPWDSLLAGRGASLFPRPPGRGCDTHWLQGPVFLETQGGAGGFWCIGLKRYL